jgi:hypothetical protein
MRASLRGARRAGVRWLVTAVTLALLPPAAGAARISAELHPTEIGLGQEARLAITVVGVQNAPAPRIPRIEGLEVRGLGQTMSMQIVGGQISSEVTHNFLLRPARTGSFAIPPLTVVAGDETLETTPLTLRVVAAGKAPQAPAPPPAAAARQARRAPTEPDRDAPPLRLSIAGLPDRDLWVGEVVPVELRLDIRGDVQVTEVTSPKLEGHAFTLTQPREQKEPPQQAITVGGVRYARFSLPAALSAVSAGEHGLEVAMTATALLPRRRPTRRGAFDDPFFDSFFGNDPFGGGRERRELPVATGPRTVKVRPLPEAGRPADFSGGIGRFRIAAKASPTEVAVGDPLTLEVTVTGEGSFDRLSLPPLPSGTEWKTYPQSATAKSRDDLGHAGSKTFEQVIIPERVDVRSVPPRELAYFDPDRGRYERAATQPIALAVRPAPGGPVAVTGGRRGAPASGEETAAETSEFEIAPNQVELGRLRPSLRPLALDPRFLALQLLPLALVAAGFALARRRERLAGDVGHQRAVAASRAVRAELARADRAVRDGDAVAFFAAARRALQERVARPERPAASLTQDEVEACVPATSAERDTVREIFAMADAVSYSGARPDASSLAEWRRRLAATVKALPAGGSRR